MILYYISCIMIMLLFIDVYIKNVLFTYYLFIFFLWLIIILCMMYYYGCNILLCIVIILFRCY